MRRSLFRGFTLIELLAVITIIGILATLAAVGVSNASKRARDAKRKSDLQRLSKAILQYNQDTGNMPANKASGVSYANTNSNFLDELVTSGILSTVPTVPSSTRDETKIYRYYDYSGGYPGSDFGNQPFFVLKTELEGEKPSTTGYGGGRPFNDGNWCNKTPTKQYCLTVGY